MGSLYPANWNINFAIDSLSLLSIIYLRLENRFERVRRRDENWEKWTQVAELVR